MATEAARQAVVSSESKSRQPAGSPALPEIHVTGESTCVVAARSTSMFCATFGLITLGSSTVTEAMTVGSSSEAMMAVSQIQRVPPRLSRAARSATNAPSESSSVTMITYSIQASIHFSLPDFRASALSASKSRMR